MADMILRPRILFIANAGPAAGGGHVMRSLSLARALEARGADCIFLASPPVAALLQAFAPDMAQEEATAIDADSVCDAVTGVRFDAVVFDHPELARAEHETVAHGRPSLVIDDLADRPLAADLILDSGPARSEADYALLTQGARLLIGPSYALVRPEFAALREKVLARRGGPVERVLIALGLTDGRGVTARVVERLRQRNGQIALDIVLGGQAPSLPGLKRIAAHDPRVTLHIDSQDMAALTAQADIALGGAGSTVWERCTLGLPSMVVVQAENQRPAALALAAREGALVVDAFADDFDKVFDRALVRLMTDPACRARLTAASAELCDGLGAGRVAEAFLHVLGEQRQPASP
jgi:UDP-2,4-diacetamido-2,4,6-trideoxy-beta-L-altropyranose hydrolase